MEASNKSQENSLGEESADDANFKVCKRNVKPLVIGDDTFCSFYDWELSEKDLERARRELGETEEKKVECIRELKSKLANDNIKYRQDDAYLLRFLRRRKYDVLKTHENLKLLFNMRKKNKDFLGTSPDIKSLQNLNWLTILPYTDEEGAILVLLHFKRWNPYEVPFERMGQTFTNVVDIVLMNPKSQINGIVAIYDFGGLTLKHCTELLKKGRLWTYASAVQTAFPFRIKKVLCINVSRYFQYLYSLVRPLFRRKIAERIIVLGSDLKDLHQHVNPALLPMSLQGSLEDEDCNSAQFVLDNYPCIRYERSFT